MRHSLKFRCYSQLILGLSLVSWDSIFKVRLQHSNFCGHILPATRQKIPRHTLLPIPTKKKVPFFFFTPNFHRSDLKDVLLNKCLKPFSSALRIWRFPPAPSHWCRSLCCQEHDSLIRLNSRCLLLFKLCLLHWSLPPLPPLYPPLPFLPSLWLPPFIFHLPSLCITKKKEKKVRLALN